MSLALFNRPAIACASILALLAGGLNAATPASAMPAASAATGTISSVGDDWLDYEVGDIPSDSQIEQAGKKARAVESRAKKKQPKRKNYAPAIRRAQAQCIPYSRWKGLSDDRQRANDIMRRGRTTIDPYGTLRVPKNPNWRRQSSLDYSGNGHMHSLFWALPLLRVGRKTKNKKMIKRFYNIIYDWIKDNPPNRPRQASAYGQIQAGYRMLTFACAFAGPAPKRATLWKAMKREYSVASRTWRSVNNASFHHASGILAMGCVIGNRKYRNRGLSFLSRITGSMIASDGSVKEGSVHYAYSTYGWTKQEMMRVSACRVKIPSTLRRVDKIPNYLGMAIRPDRRFESIGDGHPDIAQERYAPARSWWQYSSTAGVRGTRPNTNYRAFQSGILFGRSGWGVNREFSRETFYSLRYGPGPKYQYHAHQDAASLTLAAHGKQLLIDPGQYRLNGGSVASYLRTRSAHNTVSATGLSATTTVPNLRHTQSNAEGDYTAILDRPYKNSSIERKVWYDRRGDFFVVMDDIKLAKSTSTFQNWNLPNDKAVSVDSDSAHTSGSGTNLSLISVGQPTQQRLYRGSKSPWAGWTSPKYGSVGATPSVRMLTSGKTVRLVTVIVPRKTGVQADEVTATGELTSNGAIVEVLASNGEKYRLQLHQRSVVRLPLLPDEPEPTEEPTTEPTDDPTDAESGDLT
ncbi:MAG: heparinase II/III family protein [Candidatus Nanopelagicales bacterium]